MSPGFGISSQQGPATVGTLTSPIVSFPLRVEHAIAAAAGNTAPAGGGTEQGPPRPPPAAAQTGLAGPRPHAGRHGRLRPHHPSGRDATGGQPRISGHGRHLLTPWHRRAERRSRSGPTSADRGRDLQQAAACTAFMARNMAAASPGTWFLPEPEGHLASLPTAGHTTWRRRPRSAGPRSRSRATTFASADTPLVPEVDVLPRPRCARRRRILRSCAKLDSRRVDRHPSLLRQAGSSHSDEHADQSAKRIRCRPDLPASE